MIPNWTDTYYVSAQELKTVARGQLMDQGGWWTLYLL